MKITIIFIICIFTLKISQGYDAVSVVFAGPSDMSLSPVYALAPGIGLEDIGLSEDWVERLDYPERIFRSIHAIELDHEWKLIADSFSQAIYNASISPIDDSSTMISYYRNGERKDYFLRKSQFMVLIFELMRELRNAEGNDIKNFQLALMNYTLGYGYVVTSEDNARMIMR